MKTVSIESNGRLENTAIYINGEQISGIKELLITIDEQGTFDAIISFVNTQGFLTTKQLFTDDLQSLQIKEPAFSEEFAERLMQLTIESNGNLEDTSVLFNNDFVDGIVSLSIHCKSGDSKPQAQSLFSKMFSKKPLISDDSFFRSEIVFRNQDGTLSTETIF